MKQSCYLNNPKFSDVLGHAEESNPSRGWDFVALGRALGVAKEIDPLLSPLAAHVHVFADRAGP